MWVFSWDFNNSIDLAKMLALDYPWLPCLFCSPYCQLFINLSLSWCMQYLTSFDCILVKFYVPSVKEIPDVCNVKCRLKYSSSSHAIIKSLVVIRSHPSMLHNQLQGQAACNRMGSTVIKCKHVIMCRICWPCFWQWCYSVYLFLFRRQKSIPKTVLLIHLQ